ncbi:7TM-HD extracellular [compost metagenome]
MTNKLSTTYSDSLLEEMKKRINEQAYHISEETFIKIPRLTPEDISEMKPVAKDIVSRLMSDQVTEAPAVRAKVAEQVSSSMLSKRISREVVQELIRLVITPNNFRDDEATKEAKVLARESTEPVYIKQGDVLVAKGERITEEMYNLLDQNGLLKDEVNYWPQLGLLLMSLLFGFGLIMYMRQSE